jgi:tetratricopeptide (TPR) repeat protein
MSDLDARLAEVRRRISAGELTEAETILRDAADEHPTDARVHAQLGAVAYRRRDNFAAMAAVAQAIQLDPALTEARIMQIKVALRQNQNRVAVDLAEQLLDMEPGDPKVAEVASRAFGRVKNYTRAADVWRALAGQRTTEPGPLIEAAGFYMKAGAFDLAEACANEASARDPAAGEPLVIKAAVCEAINDTVKFARTVARLAEVDPARAVAFLPAVLSYGMPEFAADIILKARAASIELDEAVAVSVRKSLARQARAAHETLDGAKAARLWMALMSIEPNSEAARSGLRKIVKPLIETARHASDHGNFEQAYAWFREAIAIDSADAKLWREYAKAASAVGAWVDAAKAWLRFDDLAGPDLDTVIRASRQAAKAAETDQALPLLIEARRRFPEDAQIAALGDAIVKRMVASARLDADEGRLDEAAAAADLVALWEVDGPGAERILSKVRTALSNRFMDVKGVGGPAAVDAAEKLIKLSPTRTDARNVLAEHFYDIGDYAQAAEHYAILARQEPEKDRYWMRLLKSHAAANDYQNGVPLALTLLGKSPENAAVRQILGEMLRRQTAPAR